MGVSPTKTGEMREDQFWLLKSRISWTYCDKGEDYAVEPVTAHKVDLDAYMNAPGARKWVSILGFRIHGRRINDEVELFEGIDSEDLAGLRESLEQKGLTVRAYQPQDNTKKNKFPQPNYKAILGKEADGPCTPMEKCIDALKEGLEKLETDEHAPINYAVLIDGQVKDKGFTVCPVRSNEFCDQLLEECDTLSCRGVKYPVLAVAGSGEVRVLCDDDKFVKYFTLKRSGEYHVELMVHNYVRDLEIERQEAAEAARLAEKAAKKQAKKHRRQMTQSTATSPSEKSFVSASQSVEDEEAVKERQREKNRMKKKAQKERRRVSKREEAEKLKNGCSEIVSQQSKIEDDDKPTVYGVLGNHLIFAPSKHEELELVPRRPQIAPIVLAESPNSPVSYKNRQTTAEDQLKKRPVAKRTVSSSSENDDVDDSDGEGTGLRVLRVSTTEDIHHAIREMAKVNGNVIVATPVDEEDDKEVEDLQEGLKYVGRGL